MSAASTTTPWAIVRQLFTATDGDEARRRLRDVVGQLGVLRVPGRALAQAALHQPLERFNREIGRRSDVVGIFPDDASLIRLVSMLAIEANDEWLVGRSYIRQKSMKTLWDDGAKEDLS